MGTAARGSSHVPDRQLRLRVRTANVTRQAPEVPAGEVCYVDQDRRPVPLAL